MKEKKEIHTWQAWLIWLLVIIGAFIFTAFKPSAPFEKLALWLTVGLSAYTGKRLFQKHANFNGGYKISSTKRYPPSSTED